MHSIRFVVFLAVSVVLMAAVYSPSTTLAVNERGILTICVDTSATRTVCTAADFDNGDVTMWECTTSDGGKHWKCIQAAAGKEAISPELNDALEAAIQEESQNTTKVPEGALDDDGLLMGDDDNQTTSKICFPGDIKCLIGLPPASEAPETATSESGESNDTTGDNDDSEVSEDAGGLEFRGNTTRPES
jgi:hypothetical protein